MVLEIIEGAGFRGRSMNLKVTRNLQNHKMLIDLDLRNRFFGGGHRGRFETAASITLIEIIEGGQF